MFTIEEIWEEQEREYNQLMEEDDQYCHPESFRWGFEHGVNYALTKAGWHSASELPPVGENGNSIDVIAIDEDNEPIKVSYSKFYKCWVITDATAESFDKITIKCWCYPPKEE
jgi:hypothetical protein